MAISNITNTYATFPGACVKNDGINHEHILCNDGRVCTEGSLICNDVSSCIDSTDQLRQCSEYF